jgi:hypothetical protein
MQQNIKNRKSESTEYKTDNEIMTNIDVNDNLSEEVNEDYEYNKNERTQSVILDDQYNIKFEVLCHVFEKCQVLKTKEKLE